MNGIRRIWYRNFIIWRKGYFTSNLLTLLEPLFFIGAIGYGLGLFIGTIDGVPYLLFFAPAMVAATAMNTASFTATYDSFVKLKIQSTYQAIIMTPVSPKEVVVAEILWATTKAVFNGCGVLIVLAAFGLLGAPPLLPFMLFELLMISVCFASIGMLMMSYARNFDNFTYFFNLFLQPAFLFSGTFFPLAHLPGWAQSLSRCIPLTPGVSILRQLFYGMFPNEFWTGNLYLLVITVVCAALAAVRMERKLIQ